MRLLLETLDADRDRFRDLHDIYAIEIGTTTSASIWKAKGIKPIEFSVTMPSTIRYRNGHVMPCSQSITDARA